MKITRKTHLGILWLVVLTMIVVNSCQSPQIINKQSVENCNPCRSTTFFHAYNLNQLSCFVQKDTCATSPFYIVIDFISKENYKDVLGLLSLLSKKMVLERVEIYLENEIEEDTTFTLPPITCNKLIVKSILNPKPVFNSFILKYLQPKNLELHGYELNVSDFWTFLNKNIETMELYDITLKAQENIPSNSFESLKELIIFQSSCGTLEGFSAFTANLENCPNLNEIWFLTDCFTCLKPSINLKNIEQIHFFESIDSMYMIDLASKALMGLDTSRARGISFLEYEYEPKHYMITPWVHKRYIILKEPQEDSIRVFVRPRHK